MSIRKVALAIVSASVLLIVPAPAFAQQVGVKAGINYTYFLPKEDDEAPFFRGVLDLSPASGSACRSLPASRFK